MEDRPSDRFLSREKSTELEHKTGFSRKEILTFHKHYQACIDSLGKITEEDKALFLKELGLEEDDVALEVMESMQIPKNPKRNAKGNRGVERPLHFEEYIQSLLFVRHGHGKLDLRMRYLYQAYSSNEMGLSKDDLRELISCNLDPQLMALPRANERLLTWIKRHFVRADVDKSGYITYDEFEALMNSEHNYFKLSDIKVNMAAISDIIYKRRKREEILAKLAITLKGM